VRAVVIFAAQGGKIMSTSIWITLAVVVLAGAAVFAVLASRLAAKRGGAQFKAKPLLTPNELEFLARLESSVPELRFHAQVAMGALLDPAVPRSSGRAYMHLRNRFAQKIVDFVAQRRVDGQVVAVVELDDRTHNSARDAQRDQMLQSAGYRIVRWQSKAKPDAAAIRAALVPTFTADAVPAELQQRLDAKRRQVLGSLNPP